MTRYGAFELAWVLYLATVLAIVGLFGAAGPGRGEPGVFLLVHVALLAVVLLLPRVLRGERARRAGRTGFALAGLPTVYFGLALVLPGVNPEPWEFRWIASDRALFGCDPTVAAQALLWPPFVEVLQLCYASFYLIPIVAVIAVGRARGAVAFDRALMLVVLGFTLSYLGYLLWPSLPPYRFLWHAEPLHGVLFAERIHAAIDAAEVQRWNCFPSGHTMLSVLSLWLTWREARGAFRVLAPVVVLLVVSTIVLRYHYVTDVLAGLVGVPLTLGLGRRLEAGAPTADTLSAEARRPPRRVHVRGTSRAARTTP